MKKKIFLLFLLVFLFSLNPVIVKGEKVQDPTNPLVYYDELFFVDIDGGTNHSIALTEDGRVFTFGDNGMGQLGNNTTVDESSPLEITSNFIFGEEEWIVDVDSGGNHTGALSNANQLYLWGYNFYGQIGDSTNIDKLLPVNVTPFFSLGVGEFISDFSLGDNNTVVITNLGRVFTIGRNYNYQLGDLTAIDKNYPVDITANFVLSEGETVIKVDFDYEYAAAITNLGQIFLWGRNSDGQLGIGSLVYKNSPTNATANFNLNIGEKIVDVELGYDHTIVKTDQNRVFGFGENSYRQVGDDTSVDKSSPVYINNNLFSASLNKQYLSLAAGYKDSMIITTDGDVLTYGYGDYGQRGNGSNLSYTSKSNITINFNLLENETIIQGEMGLYHTLTLTSMGRIFSFGRNNQGQLGLGTVTAYNAFPTLVVSKPNLVAITDNFLPIDENIVDVATGYLSSVLVTETGKVFTWGANDFGSLGNDYLASFHYSPTEITSNFTLQPTDKITKVFALLNSSSFAAISLEGKVFVWGYNAFGNIGDYTTTEVGKPKDITSYFSVPIGDKITHISFGTTHSLALSNNGVIWSWGTNDQGQLGNASTTNYFYPQNIKSRFSLNVGEQIIKVDAGYRYSAALTNQGRLFMWGSRTEGQLGDAAGTTKVILPSERNSLLGLNVGETVVDFDLGHSHTLVLTSEGRVIGFGSNNFGQVGKLSTSTTSLPFDMTSNLVLLGEGVTSLIGGHGATVVITDNNRIIAFGSSNSNLSILSTLTPTDITDNYNFGVLETIDKYALSTINAFVITSDNRLLATGRNDYYTIGNGLNSPLENYNPIQINKMSSDVDNILLVESPEVSYNITESVPIIIYPEFNIGSSLLSITVNGMVYSSFDVFDGRIFVNVNHSASFNDTLSITVESFEFLNSTVSVTGNVSSETLFIEDTIAPTFDFIENQEIESGDYLDIDWTTYILNEEDNIEGVLTKIEVDDSVDYNTPGTYNVTVKLVDEMLNETSQSFSVTVVDTTAPTFDLILDQAIDAGVSDIDWTTYILNEADNSDGVLTKVEVLDTVDYNTPGNYPVTVKLMDVYGNETSQTFIVSVFDIDSPTFDLILDQVIEAGLIDIDWSTYIVNEMDNSDGVLTKIELFDEVDYDTPGSYFVMVSLIDESFNETIQMFMVTVIDTTAPSFDLIGDQIIELGTPDIDWSTYITNEVDNSDLPLTKIEFIDGVDYITLGTYQVTVILVDGSANGRSRTFHVTIVDTTAPVFDIIPDQTIEVDINGSYPWTSLIVNEVDNSTDPLPRTVEEDNVIYSQVGTYTVTVKLMDQSGNASFQTFAVHVVDTMGPTFDFIDDQILELGVSYDNEFWRLVVPNLLDNSSEEVTISVDDSAVDYTKIGVYPLIVIATDNYANQTSQGILVEIFDTTPPRFDYIIAQTIEAAEYTDIDWTTYMLNPTDNSDTTLIKIEDIDNVIYNKVGDYEVVVRLVDQSGNETTQTFIVTVADTVSPNFLFIEDQVIEVGEFTDVNWSLLVENLEDNGTDALEILEVDRVDYSQVGTYTVTIVVSDNRNNQMSRDFTVEVLDTTAPSADPVDLQVIQAGDYIYYPDLVVNLYDNSNEPVDIYVYSDMVDYYTPGTYVATLRLMDLYNNIFYLDINVEVIDTLAPYISYIEDQTIEAGELSDFDWTTLMTEVYDNTLKEMEKYVISSDINYNLIGAYQVILGARDSSMNEAVITVNVNVVDTVAPKVYLMQAVDTIFTGDEYIDQGVLAIDISATNINVAGSVDITTPGVYTLTYTAEDGSGNLSMIQRIVTVLPKEAKVEFSLLEALTTINVGDEYIDGGCNVIINDSIYEMATIKETNLDRDTAGIYYILYAYTYQDIEYTYQRIVFVVDGDINIPGVLVMWKEDEE